MSRSLFDKYKGTLTQLSARTGASVPSLFASFLVLHEVTAIVPFIGVFYASRALGVGESVVSSMAKSTEDNDGIAQAQVRQWMSEGEQMAERVGQRYGIFGFEKKSKSSQDSSVPMERISPTSSGRIAGEIANVVVAYGAVKVALPLRIGISLYLAPPFSRLVFEPVRRSMSRLWNRKTNS